MHLVGCLATHVLQSSKTAKYRLLPCFNWELEEAHVASLPLEVKLALSSECHSLFVNGAVCIRVPMCAAMHLEALLSQERLHLPSAGNIQKFQYSCLSLSTKKFYCTHVSLSRGIQIKR